MNAEHAQCSHVHLRYDTTGLACPNTQVLVRLHAHTSSMACDLSNTNVLTLIFKYAASCEESTSS